MASDNIPIHAFVEAKYSTPAMQRLVEGWRVEPRIVVERLVEHFREMGIFQVTRQNETLIIDGIRHQLKNSPEILRLVMRMQVEEQRRAKSRHANG